MDKDLIIGKAVEAAVASEFKWGTADCCTFVCDALLEMHDIDFMRPLRGRYDSEKSAARVLRDYSGGGLVRAAQQLALEAGLVELDWPFENALLGIVSGGPGPVLALHHHGHWLARTLTGVRWMPLQTGVIAWGFE